MTTRCPAGHPVVIAVAPRLDDGSLFPTVLWLTCPVLVSAVSDRESAGASAHWSARLRSEPALAERVRAVDVVYREMRRTLGEGADPCGGVGMAGQVDPLAVKCLHARTAAALCGLDDPIGIGVLLEIGDAILSTCDDPRCRQDEPRNAG